MTAREIFEAAIRILDRVERERFLEKACRGNATLRDDVDRLLKDFAEQPTDDIQPAVDAPEHPAASPGGSSRTSKSVDPLIGQSIGGVKLVRVISEGGMGQGDCAIMGNLA